MELQIPPLSQQDPRWASKKLGNSTTLTIKSDGCLLVCHAMMMTYFGHECTPDVLNEIYKTKGCFDGAMINFYAAGNVYGDVNAVEYYNCTDVPCELGKIDGQLAKKQPVIAWVDNVNKDNKPDHFVLIKGKTDDGHYLTNDPWTGETYFFDAKWGDPATKIYGLRIYNGTPKQEVNYADEVNKLREQLITANETLSAKSQELAMALEELQKAKDRAISFEELYNKAVVAKNEAELTKGNLEIQVKGLEAKLENQADEIETLKARVKELEKNGAEGLTKWQLFKLFWRRG